MVPTAQAVARQFWLTFGCTCLQEREYFCSRLQSTLQFTQRFHRAHTVLLMCRQQSWPRIGSKSHPWFYLALTSLPCCIQGTCCWVVRLDSSNCNQCSLAALIEIIGHINSTVHTGDVLLNWSECCSFECYAKSATPCHIPLTSQICLVQTLIWRYCHCCVAYREAYWVPNCIQGCRFRPSLERSDMAALYAIWHPVCVPRMPCSDDDIVKSMFEPGRSELWVVCVGLARTIYTRCIYNVSGREITKYTVIYGVYIRFWPTLGMRHGVADYEYHTWLGLARTVYIHRIFGDFPARNTVYTP